MDNCPILHIDINNCYASISILHHPKLKGHPVAVGGSVESRHGIILARNYEAKPYGIHVGLALWQAKQKCPNLIIIPPEYDKYLKYGRLFRNILADYTDLVESFGLDECWCDVSRCMKLYGSGEAIAQEIRERVKSELGVTVSIGVSYNKIFAKLGSDIKKPDAVTLISKANYRDLVWPLPAADLLGVGRATTLKFNHYGIKTIGDIANSGIDTLKSFFGKWGEYLYVYANGLDSSPVKKIGFEAAVKSVGNSTTCPRDLENEEDARIVFHNLADSVSERMRELGLMAKTVQISLRTNDLQWFERQMALPQASMISGELAETAMILLKENYTWDKPLRSIGIRGTQLTPINSVRQLSLLENEEERQQLESLEYTIDDIRRRYGYHAIGKALLVADEKLGKLNAKADHVLHPVGYL